MDVFISETAVIKHKELFKYGNHIAIDHGFYCTTQLKIGNYIHIAPYVTIIGGSKSVCTIGDFCTIAAGARIVVKGDSHQGFGLVSPVIPEKYRDKVIGNNIIMHKYSALGTNAVIFPNSEIMEGTVIGAGAIFTGGTTIPWRYYVGNPAKPIDKIRPSDTMKKYGEILLNKKV